jgi:hypothetical protein
MQASASSSTLLQPLLLSPLLSSQLTLVSSSCCRCAKVHTLSCSRGLLLGRLLVPMLLLVMLLVLLSSRCLAPVGAGLLSNCLAPGRSSWCSDIQQLLQQQILQFLQAIQLSQQAGVVASAAATAAAAAAPVMTAAPAASAAGSVSAGAA